MNAFLIDWTEASVTLADTEQKFQAYVVAAVSGLVVRDMPDGVPLNRKRLVFIPWNRVHSVEWNNA